LDGSRYAAIDVRRCVSVGEIGPDLRPGSFQAIKDHYPTYVLCPRLIGVSIGNTIEAGAYLGGMAAAVHIFIPLSERWIRLIIAIVILSLQILDSYSLIRNIFRVNDYLREITGQKFTRKTSGHGLGHTRG
jgi:hypothetical protein